MVQERKRDRAACCQGVEDLLQPGFFKALADPTRISVLLQVLARSEAATVQEIAGSCRVDLSVVSRHLVQLRSAGILSSEKRGREVHYAVRYGEIVRLLRRLADSIEACCPDDSSAEVCRGTGCGEGSK